MMDKSQTTPTLKKRKLKTSEKSGIMLALTMCSVLLGGISFYFLFGVGPGAGLALSESAGNTSLAPGIGIIAEIGALIWNIVVIGFGALVCGMLTSVSGFVYLMVSKK